MSEERIIKRRKPRPRKFAERFWKRVIKGEKENDCWDWDGTVSVDGGYAVIYYAPEKPTMKAHRLSWMLHFGEIPEGQIVCHKCDNPRCCNPKHLFLGEFRHNVHDMVLKERHGRMKFTHEQVERIRALYGRHRDHLSYQRIADWFKVSKATITHMMTGRNWVFAEGAHKRGVRKRRYNTILDEEKVREIRRRRKDGEKLISLSKHFGINQSGIAKICNGETWTHVK
jgi:hypothetical protein